MTGRSLCGRSALWRTDRAGTHRRGRVHHGEVVAIEEGGSEGSHESGHDERPGPVLGEERTASEWVAPLMGRQSRGNSRREKTRRRLGKGACGRQSSRAEVPPRGCLPAGLPEDLGPAPPFNRPPGIVAAV